MFVKVLLFTIDFTIQLGIYISTIYGRKNLLSYEFEMMYFY